MTAPLDPRRFRPDPVFTAREAAERAGVDLEAAKRLHRALGLPEVDEGEIAFDDRDVEALSALHAIVDAGVPFDDVVSVARVYGEALSRIADVETRLFTSRVAAPLEQEGLPPEEVAARLEPLVDELLVVLDRALGYVHRTHLALALERSAGRGEAAGEVLATAFVDLVDFARIADDLHPPELTHLTGRFEEIAIEACTTWGVRLVKVIGDAVMLVSSDADALLRASATIVAEVESDTSLPHARAGIDMDRVVASRGDYFGRAVNVAARVTAFARPGTVVVSQSLLEALEATDVDAGRIGSQRLKGVGRVRLFKVRTWRDRERISGAVTSAEEG